MLPKTWKKEIGGVNRALKNYRIYSEFDIFRSARETSFQKWSI